MKYRQEIDGLRALAVIPVILFHAGFDTFSGGFVGVDVFFVISGYLITSIIISEKEKGEFSLLNFYERRARRILPALFFVILCCLPFAWYFLLPGALKEFSESLLATILFSSNIYFWTTDGYFQTDTNLIPLIHTWSLAVEEQFYLLFPVFITLLYKIGKQSLTISVILLFIASLILSEWGAITHPVATFYLLPTRGWELLVGSFIALYENGNTSRLAFGKLQMQLSSFIGLAMLICSILLFDKVMTFPGFNALIPTVGTALILMFSIGDTTVNKILRWKVLVWIGTISYSAYLWHVPIFSLARHNLFPEEPGKYIFSLLIVITIFLAHYSWKFIETPFRNKSLFGKRKILILSVTFCCMFFLIGSLGSLTNGFIDRYIEQDKYLASLRPSVEGVYVYKRFSALRMAPFNDNDERKKILIIGDSYAEDLVNALYESPFVQHLQLSTRHISSKCGNLFIERHRFSENYSSKIQRSCVKEGIGIYEDDQLKKKMLNSDEIWFASSWRTWQIQYLAESISNVQDFSGKTIRVFGTKSFGSVNIRKLLNSSPGERMAMKGLIEPSKINTNNRVKSLIQPDIYIDVIALLCGTNSNQCDLLDSDGHLISFDGVHLTKHGAKYFGNQLIKLNRFKSITN